MKEGWKYCKLAEVASLINGDRGKNYPSVKDFVTEGFPFINAGHITNESISFDEMNYITEEKFLSLNSGKVQLNDIVFCLRGSLGKLALIDFEQGAIASSLVIIRCNNNDAKYIKYALSSNMMKEYIVKNDNGSSQPNISAKSISEFYLPYPSLPEQEKIVAELDLLSEVIDKQRVQLRELDTLAQSIFYDMFGDPVENEKGWETAELNKVCDVRDGTHDSPQYYEDGYPLITSKNVIDGKISFDNVNYICEEDFVKISKRSYVDDGDIIMPMIGTIGKPTIVAKTREFAIKNVALIKFTPNSTVINLFVQAIMSSHSFDDYMKSKNKGGTQKFIALGDIRKLNIPIPPLGLQQSFATKIEAIEKQKEQIKKSLEETETLFNSRMDYWFN